MRAQHSWAGAAGAHRYRSVPREQDSVVGCLHAGISRNGSQGKAEVKLENEPVRPDEQQRGS